MADNQGRDPNRRFHEDLVGLDPDDPEAQAFARHLDRMQDSGPGYTIEASLRRVGEFADSSNQAGGLRWLFAVLVVCAVLLGVAVTAWGMLGEVWNWLTG